MQIRLDKFLVECGCGTRSEVKSTIRKKQVTINGTTAVKPEQKINPETDSICCNGKKLVYEQFSTFLFYKPAGCVTARTDKTEKTVMDYFPDSMKKCHSPVGRLDKDTEGILLITNDGTLNHRLSSPSYHVNKTYYAMLDSPVPEEAAGCFLKGVDIGDEKPCLPAKLVILPERAENAVYAAELTVCEGRFHQVKRMFAAVGCKVLYLKRLTFAGLSLKGLEKGSYRKLTEEEISDLMQMASLKNERV